MLTVLCETKPKQNETKRDLRNETRPLNRNETKRKKQTNKQKHHQADSYGS